MINIPQVTQIQCEINKTKTSQRIRYIKITNNQSIQTELEINIKSIIIIFNKAGDSR